MMQNEPTKLLTTGKRLISLDAFRGFTIAGMIIVNDPGSWAHVYPPLRHANWHGATPTDFVFPFFLYIVGVSIALAYTKRKENQVPMSQMSGKIWKRFFIIFALGLFLALFPSFNFPNIRVPGVLQRIAIVFLICAFLFLKTSWKTQLYIGIGLLVGYWILMAVVPVPIDDVVRQAIETGQVMGSGGLIDVKIPAILSEGFIAANFEPGLNMEAWVDRHFVPGRLWQKTWDPEGLLSTIPAVATGITGMLAGKLWLSDQKMEDKLIWLFSLGFAAIAIGGLWNYVFPYNKNLWSSSFVLYTSGLATMGLAASIWLVDVKGYQKWTKIGLIFGANAITAYVLHGMLSHLFTKDLGFGISFKKAIFDGMVHSGLEPMFASFIYAIGYTLLCFIPIYIMYKRKIFVKI